MPRSPLPDYHRMDADITGLLITGATVLLVWWSYRRLPTLNDECFEAALRKLRERREFQFDTGDKGYSIIIATTIDEAKEIFAVDAGYSNWGHMKESGLNVVVYEVIDNIRVEVTE